MTTNTPRNDYHFIEVIIAIISIIITEFISCFIPSPKKLLKSSLATSHSPKKKARNSSKQISTTIQKTEVNHATVVSTETSVESCVATGNLSMPTSNLKVGTMSQITKTSRNGRSTQSRSRRTTKKSSRTTQTLGFQSLD